MTPELKAKWLAALRGGEYRQAHKMLCNEGRGFCCIGVLLDVSGEGVWDEDYVEFVLSEGYDNDGSTTTLDGDLGLRGCRIFGVTPEVNKKLVAMNDDEGRDFRQIADYIEANVPADYDDARVK